MNFCWLVSGKVFYLLKCQSPDYELWFVQGEEKEEPHWLGTPFRLGHVLVILPQIFLIHAFSHSFNKYFPMCHVLF